MRSARLALAGASLLAPACVAPELATTQHEVIGGTMTSAGELEGVGALMYDTFDGPVANCTGALIAPDVVLTAAHCIHPLVIGGVPGFTLARDTVTSPPAIILGRESIPHEAFDTSVQPGPGLGDAHDLGLLLLETPITDVAPVRMVGADDVADIAPELEVTIVGYGRRSAIGAALGIKYDATATLVALNAAELQVSAEGEPQTCHGDSGGPALANLGDGLRAVGVVSRVFDGTSNCRSGTTNTRVDPYLDWIHGKVTTGIPCSSGLSPSCPDDGGCATSPTSALWTAVLVVFARVRRRRRG